MTVPAWLCAPLEKLTAAHREGRLPHALLIHGPPGWGESRLAEALALALLNRQGSARELAHSDFRWLAPEGPGEQIRIDEVRELAEFAAGTPQLGPLKVAVIERAERLNPHAANALLKTLEEPPGATHLILTTSVIEHLLPTIRSRCQRVVLSGVSPDEAMTWVRGERPTADQQMLNALGFEYGYAPFAVLAALDNETEPLAASLHALAAGKDPLRIAETLTRSDLDDVAIRWMRHVSDRIQQHAEAGCPADESLFEFWRELKWVRRLVRGGTNPNPRLVLEGLCCAWRDLRPT